MSKHGLIILTFLCILIMSPNTCFTEDVCVHGWIYDAQSGSALEGVNVIYVDTSETESIINTITTNPNGYYEVCPDDPGNLRILMWALGFSAKIETVEIAVNQESHNFSLMRAGTITVNVLNNSNQPIDGARVNLEYLENHSFPLTINEVTEGFETKADGVTELKHVDSSRQFRLIVTHSEYKTYVSSDMTIQSGKEASIDIVLYNQDQ